MLIYYGTVEKSVSKADRTCLGMAGTRKVRSRFCYFKFGSGMKMILLLSWSK